jgi:P-type Ca2+ transporter type 2C
MTQQGLTSEEAAKKLKEFGPNEIREINKVSFLSILLRQVKKNFIIYLLAFTATLSFLLGKNLTGYVIILVITIVIVTGFIQEYKAEKAISALRQMIMPVSRVIRGGKEQEIPSSEIVPGDIIILRTGEKVPADAVIIDQVNVKTNESILTGEPTDVTKKETSSPEKYTDENLVFMGSYIVNGKCTAQVLHTGMNTKFGKIAGMISTAEKKLPLQDKVNAISKYMAIVGIVSATVTGAVLLMRVETMTAEALVGIFIIVIALCVSSFPEGFPVVLTTTLAAGVSRMARQNVVINRMSIIETLGETSVICSDKTGTITKGEMTVKKIFTDNKIYEVTGTGYEIDGQITENNNKVSITPNSPLELLLKTATLCNDTVIEDTGDEKTYKVKGTATEGALLILAAKTGLFKEDIKYRRTEEIPFDSVRKMMSTAYQVENKNMVFAKGAPEVILSKCTHIHTQKGIEKLTDAIKENISQIHSEMTQEALRGLAFAYKENNSNSTSYTEDSLIFLGLTGMEDPPREEVKDAIALCMESGIKVKMITGDNPSTAKAIGEQIGLVGEVIEGHRINEMSDEELIKIVPSITIFSRVQPEHKLRIVRALKANNEIVTMTGDGVNDAPALKEAHIGVAMGINGTDVSRSVADITLKDDNFATITNAIKEGRTVFNNIRKFIVYQLASNLCFIYIIVLGVIIAPHLGWFAPIITAIQVLFMNIVTDNMPAITLGLTPTSKDIMKERPRKNAQILTGEFIDLIILNGVSMGLITLCITYIAFNVMALDPEVARTTVLVSLILMQIANAYNFRSFRYRVINRGLFVNKYLVVASLLSVTATLLIIYTPLNILFETTPLELKSWLLALLAPLAIVVMFDIQKIINNKTHYFLKHTT